ncbi:MAG: shikimate kinase [Nitrospirota bacterium]|nr:shikimate kinase [Nitrospirota bacterium]
MECLFLTGFMGTGKSVVGPLVARHLGYEFVDLDRVIERAAGKSIPKLFETEGEAAFRSRETDALRQVARRDGCVVATGGGAVTIAENRRIMAATGHVVCLTASVAAIVRRTRRHRAGRPLLDTGGSLASQVESLLEARAPYYRECHHVVDTTGRPVDDVAREVVRLHREGTWKR